MPLPSSFLQSIKNIKGFNQQTFEAIHQSGNQITSIRRNPTKISAEAIEKHFGLSTVDKIAWSEYGYYLHERPSFIIDPLLHAGAYYVQEASSMFLETAFKQIVSASQSCKVLDLCAAPGGKSTLLLSLLNSKSFLVSNEVIKTRVNVLVENITKHGYSNVVVTNNDAKDFQQLPNFFDVIVADAPCSGSGLFRKDENAIAEWSLKNVALCSQRQQRILADVLPSLKENGFLIYSTCSYSIEENEDILDWLVSEFNFETIQLNCNQEWDIVETLSAKQMAFGYRFYPDKIKGEGFFIALLRKKELPSNTNYLSKKNIQFEEITKNEIDIIEKGVNQPKDIFYTKINEAVFSFSSIHKDDFLYLKNNLYIKKMGIKMGQIMHRELIPAHDFAMSLMLSDSVPFIETDRETALQYLRKNDISINSNEKGWALIKYQNQPLGWVKILQGRTNNYYPKEWRILNK